MAAGKAVDVATAMAHKFNDCVTTYTERDVALYALTVGAAEDPLDKADLPLVYEMSGEGFRTMPSFAVTFPFDGMKDLTATPGLTFNPMMLLHGEQELQLFGALPTSGTITSKMSLGGIYDKGKGASVLLDSTSYDASGRKVCTQRSTVFIRGIGGFGGDAGPKLEAWDIPSRAPCATAEYKTLPNQALVYRLNGDSNPLHADPDMAAVGGFDKPILHGLCTFGVACRAILKHFCNNEVEKFSGIKGRFANPVFPGETIVTQMWQTSTGTITFQCTVKERATVAITRGVATVAPTSSKL